MSDKFTETAEPRVPHAFQAIDATVSYGGVPVLHGVSLDIPTGRTTAVLGPNGSGKSTLMRAMLGIVPLDRGEIRVHGTPLRRFRDWRRIGYVPQRLSAGGSVPATVREIVASGRVAVRRRLSLPGVADRRAVDKALQTVGLTDRARDSVRELSGGQQQRVLIARALAGEPDTFVMDEPMAGVDTKNQQALAETIQLLSEQGSTVVLVLHELGPLKNVIERTVSLDSGHIDDRAFEPTDVCVRPGRQQRSPEPDATAPRSVPMAMPRLEVPRND